MLAQCWASVADGGPALRQHWVNVSCLMGRQCTHPNKSMVAKRRPSDGTASKKLAQHLPDVYPIWRSQTTSVGSLYFIRCGGVRASITGDKCSPVQRETTVTTHVKSERLLLFAWTRQCIRQMGVHVHQFISGYFSRNILEVGGTVLSARGLPPLASRGRCGSILSHVYFCRMHSPHC